MRGGALPLIAWATLLFILAVGDAVWDQKLIQAGTAFFVVLSILSLAGAYVLASGRQAVRRGPPEPVIAPEAVPRASLGAVLVAVSLAMILFGMAWARFLVYFGIFCLVVSLARVVLEVRAERRALQHVREER